jgi:ribosomal protein S18 acetylase RimI-like enzyme
MAKFSNFFPALLSMVGKKFHIRPVAHRGEMHLIKNINNQYLPEKYTIDFLIRHYDAFPTLAFVAESESREKVVGYAIGRVKTKTLRGDSPFNHESVSTSFGHISSVCVIPEWRGLGVATCLMDQLHAQFIDKHDVMAVTLHVRVSNTPAIKLYSECFGYRCAERLRGYYEDGEDAWIMMNDDVRTVHEKRRLYVNPNQIEPSASTGDYRQFADEVDAWLAREEELRKNKKAKPAG